MGFCGIWDVVDVGEYLVGVLIILCFWLYVVFVVLIEFEGCVVWIEIFFRELVFVIRGVDKLIYCVIWLFLF